MLQNGHYLVYVPTYSNIFLMKIVYNNSNGAVEIQTYSTAAFYGISSYSIPDHQPWSLPATGTVPVYYVPNTGIQQIFGFTGGYYPALSVGGGVGGGVVLNNASEAAVGFLSNTVHSIRPSYSIVYYKPNNSRFSAQGGVSSSDLTLRVKYDSITTTASTFTKVFGAEVGSAVSYGVPSQAYTVKDKIGYPSTKTPVIDKYTGELKCKSHGNRTGYCMSEQINS
jgi:hypothetical protein